MLNTLTERSNGGEDKRRLILEAAVRVFAQRGFKWVAPVFVALMTLAFAFYYPIWAGVPMSPDQIHAREYWQAY